MPPHPALTRPDPCSPQVTVVEVNANCTAENIEWLLTEFYKWQPWDSLSRTWASIDFRVGAFCLSSPRAACLLAGSAA